MKQVVKSVWALVVSKMWKNSLFFKSRKAEKVGYNVYTYTYTHTEGVMEIFISLQVKKIKGDGGKQYFFSFIFTTIQEEH